MPYLKITCPQLSAERKRVIAQHLTEAVNDLFFNPRSGMTREQLRERTTVHFTTYDNESLWIGGRTPSERGVVDVTVELSDWNMPVRQQRKVARVLTPILAELLAIPPSQPDGINIRFHPYPPTDFAVGGRLLSEIVPRIGQILKRIFG